MTHEGGSAYTIVAERWECAFDLANQSLDDLREIFPIHTWHLTETGSRSIDEAMVHIKDGIMALHRAGRHVLGVEQYDSFMEERTERAVERTIERGEI